MGLSTFALPGLVGKTIVVLTTGLSGYLIRTNPPQTNQQSQMKCKNVKNDVGGSAAGFSEHMPWYSCGNICFPCLRWKQLCGDLWGQTLPSSAERETLGECRQLISAALWNSGENKGRAFETFKGYSNNPLVF